MNFIKAFRQLLGLYILFVVFSCASLDTFGVSKKENFLNLSQRIRCHPKLKQGQLQNGLRYLLLNNPNPKDRISLRLVVNAGAFMEKDDEDGLAHFIEHMVFNGSTHFAPGTLIQYFQRIGMSFGNDTNAFTSWTHTVFQLELPNNDMDTLQQGLDVLYDQCSEGLFLPQEINRERGIILSELRARDSANYRAHKAELEFLFPNHLLSKRFVIGTESTINAFQSSNFFDFYKRWYTPDRMTLVAVGDFRDKQMQKWVKKRFANISKKPIIPSLHFGQLIQPKDGMSIKVYRDKELTSTCFALSALHTVPILKHNSLKQVQNQCVWQLIDIMLKYRMDELVKQSHLQDGNFNFFADLPGLESASINFWSKNEDFEATCKELEKFFRHTNTFGFSQKELDLAKKAFRKGLQEIADAEHTDSNLQADTIVSAIISKLTYVSGSQALAYFNRLESSLTPELCNRVWKNLWDEGLYLFVYGDLQDTVHEQLIQAIWTANQQQVLQPNPGKNVTVFKKPTFGSVPGEIADTQLYPDVQVECLRFKNNVRVNLKKTDFENNRILISVSLGAGMLSIPDKQWEGLSHLISSSFVGGGLVQCDATTVNWLFADKSVNLDFDVGDDAFAFKAKTTREHLEDQLNLVGAYILEPGYRQEALDLFKKNIPAWYHFFTHTPEGVLKSQIPRFLTNEDPRFGYPKPSIIVQRNFEEAQRWLNPVFEKDYMEIAVVGDFDRNETIKILQSTFGALPERTAGKNRFEQERTVEWPTRPQIKGFTCDSIVDKGLIEVIWPTESIWNVDHVRKLNILGDILENRLLFTIRQAMGDTYSPKVVCQHSETFTNRGAIAAVLSIDPQKASDLAHKIVCIANEIAEQGITSDELTRAINPFVTNLKDSLQTNAYWMNIIRNAQEYPVKLTWPVNCMQAYQAIQIQDVQQMAQLYLKANNALQIIIAPQAK
ncbi:MAG: insulinase family protein [Puniceicoccales bacterium]|jgi:zinc protease|nr:insulinase family protein [Puniceicoccales bacterium]